MMERIVMVDMVVVVGVEVVNVVVVDVVVVDVVVVEVDFDQLALHWEIEGRRKFNSNS